MVKVVLVELLHDEDEPVDGLKEELFPLLEDVFLPRYLVAVITINDLEVNSLSILFFNESLIKVGSSYVIEVKHRELFVEGNILL